MFLRVHMHYLTFASLDGTIEYSAELFNLKTPELLFPNLRFGSPNNSKNPNNSVMNLFSNYYLSDTTSWILTLNISFEKFFPVKTSFFGKF